MLEARATLSYGSESWAMRRTDDTRLISTETLFMKTAEYALLGGKEKEEIMTNYGFTNNIIHRTIQKKLERTR